MKSKREKLLKQWLNKQGYCQVTLWKNNKKKNFRINRLVAETFIHNPYNKPEVNHIDTNKLNNKVDNLEWNTHSENQKHAWKNSLKEKVRKHASELGKTKSKLVNQYDLQMNFIKTWKSVRETQRQLKINQSSISACCLGKQKTAGGYIWKYKT